jgi:hypothetical protein
MSRSCSKGPLVKGGWQRRKPLTGGFFYFGLFRLPESSDAGERRAEVVAPYRFPVDGIPLLFLAILSGLGPPATNNETKMKI